MRTPPSASEIARRIVQIQAQLMQKHSPRRRNRLMGLQRALWDSAFPDYSFDQIEATLH